MQLESTPLFSGVPNNGSFMEQPGLRSPICSHENFSFVSLENLTQKMTFAESLFFLMFLFFNASSKHFHVFYLKSIE